MTKCFIYARASSRTAGKKGTTIEGQLNRLREYAAREGYEVVREFAETSGAKLKERKKLKQMLWFLRSSTEADTLLVEDATRLYRDRAEGARLETALAGITIVQTKDGEILSKPSTAQVRLLRDISRVVVGYYNACRKEEASKKLRASPPEVPHGYFYNHETRRIEPHPITAKRVKRQFERCAAGPYSFDTLSDRISQGLRGAGRRRTAKRLTPGYLRASTPRGKEG